MPFSHLLLKCFHGFPEYFPDALFGHVNLGGIDAQSSAGFAYGPFVDVMAFEDLELLGAGEFLSAVQGGLNEVFAPFLIPDLLDFWAFWVFQVLQFIPGRFEWLVEGGAALLFFEKIIEPGAGNCAQPAFEGAPFPIVFETGRGCCVL